MLENVKIEIIKLEDSSSIKKVLITLKKNGKQVSFIRDYGDEIPNKVRIVNELVIDGAIVKDGYKNFELKYSNYLTDEELQTYYKGCILINKKLSFMFGDYVEQWG